MYLFKFPKIFAMEVLDYQFDNKFSLCFQFIIKPLPTVACLNIVLAFSAVLFLSVPKIQ